MLVSRHVTSPLDQFVETSPFQHDLYQFLSNFLIHLQRITVSLRNREIFLLKLISKPRLLQYDSKQPAWLDFPKLDAILKLFNLEEVNYKKIERAYRSLFEHNIISFTGLLNLNKIGLNYFLVDNNHLNNTIILREKRKFYIKCSSEKNLDSVNSSVILTNWSWNINLSSYQGKLSDPWQSFSIPYSFGKLDYPEGYIDWSLTENNHPETLTTDYTSLITNNETIVNILDKTTHKIPLDRDLLTNKIQFVYPNIQYIGLDFKIALRFSSKDHNLFLNIKKWLLHFPIVHVFTNEVLHQGLAYLHIPRQFFSHFIDYISNLSQIENLTFIFEYF
jgi:hypothetical protein